MAMVIDTLSIVLKCAYRIVPAYIIWWKNKQTFNYRTHVYFVEIFLVYLQIVYDSHKYPMI